MVCARFDGEKKMRLRAFLVCTLLAVSATAAAHHSPAMFDTEKITKLQGIVRDFQWHNPHCYVQLLVKDAKGKEVEWSLEMGAPMYLYNKGWRPSSLKAGDSISVTLAPLRSGKAGGLLVEVVMPDGRKLGGVSP
jgi:Family of unknown function (DUF6152)